MTQRIASMMFDLPQPFGPTMPDIFVGRCSVVGSTKDLKPDSLIVVKRMKTAASDAPRARASAKKSDSRRHRYGGGGSRAGEIVRAGRGFSGAAAPRARLSESDPRAEQSPRVCCDRQFCGFAASPAGF